MPRIRTLKPEHKVHRKVGPLSHLAYRLWVGMLTEADDEGRLVGDLAQLRAVILPYHPLSLEKLDATLEAISRAGLIRRYECRGIPYIAFPSWADHQKRDAHHFTPSKLPCPPDVTTQSLNGDSHETPTRLPRADTTGKGREGKGTAGTPSGDSEETPSPLRPAFQIPESIRTALTRTPRLATALPLQTARFWQAQVRARPSVNFAQELLKAEAWLEANPTKRPKSNLPAFLQRWFARAVQEGP